MSRMLRFWPDRERERQRVVVALEQLAGPAERLRGRCARAPLGQRHLQQQELLVGQAVARDLRVLGRARRVQRGDRVAPQRQAAADAHARPAAGRRSRRCAAGAARRARAGRASRACARRRRRPPCRSCAAPPPPRPAPRARARPARGRARRAPWRAAAAADPGRSVRARKPWLNQIAVAGARVVAHGRLDDAQVAPARRPHVHGDELDAHRGLGTDDHVAQRRHALRVVAPGPRRRLEQVAGGVDAALGERGRDRLGTHLDLGRPGGRDQARCAASAARARAPRTSFRSRIRVPAAAGESRRRRPAAAPRRS